jgi:lysophospholipase L1-like esterase
MPGRIALVGDSVFDNRAYTGGEPDVIEHLRSILRGGWEATLHAVDGALTADVERQMAHVSREATHIVVSIGGNDALQNADLLARPSVSTAHTLALFADRIEQFEGAYRRALRPVVALRRATTVCTIYNGRLEPAQARIARVALTMFNDAILRTAFEATLTVIDLRLVCTEADDYANPIEPSGRGGKKIAVAIAHATGAIGQDRESSAVFAR